MTATYDRVQMLLEPGQRRALSEIAKRQGKSVAEVTRQVIDLGIEELKTMDEFERRAIALQRADQLRSRLKASRSKMPDLGVVLEQLREERNDEITAGHVDCD